MTDFVVNWVSQPVQQLGESPLWHPVEQCLYWLDCLDTAIFRYCPVTHQQTRWQMPEYLGAIAYRQSGGLIATTRHGFATIDLATETVTPIVTVLDPKGSVRMNDGKCDRQGRFWAGSAGDDAHQPQGQLFRLTANGRVDVMAGSLVISNGLGWSPDNRYLYHNDSLGRRMYRYAFDETTGEISDQQAFHQPQGMAEPDGLTVDAEGYIWVAFWGGSCVRRYHPNGQLDLTIEMPCARPTSVMFGDHDLRTLYVTSCNHVASRGESPAAHPAGCLFSCRVEVPGLPEVGVNF